MRLRVNTNVTRGDLARGAVRRKDEDRDRAALALHARSENGTRHIRGRR